MKGLYWLAFGIILVGITAVSSCSGSLPTPLPTTNITVATDASTDPFEYVNQETKQIEGLDIDIMNAIAARQNLNVEYKNVEFGRLLAEMTQKKYDAAISSIIIKDEYKGDILFSDPYFAAGQIVAVRIDETAITGKDSLAGQIGVQAGTAGEVEVKKIKTVTCKSYDKIDQAFVGLAGGEVNAVVCDNPVALVYIGKNPDKFKTAGKVFTDERYGIAVAKGKTDLLNKINAGLKAVQKESLIDQLSQKWLK